MQGANLPARRQLIEGNMILTSGWSGRELYALFLVHQLLWCTLLVAGLIEYDGHRVRWPVYLPALVLAAVAGAAMPVLHPVPAWGGLGGWYQGPIDTLAGLAAGIALGYLLSRCEPIARRNGTWFGFACIGLVLGWQAAVGLAVLALVWQAVAAVLGRRIAWVKNVPTSLVLVVLSLAWLANWATIAQWIPMGG